MRKLFNFVKEKISSLTSKKKEVTKKSNTKSQSWEDRKSELLQKSREKKNFGSKPSGKKPKFISNKKMTDVKKPTTLKDKEEKSEPARSAKKFNPKFDVQKRNNNKQRTHHQQHIPQKPEINFVELHSKWNLESFNVEPAEGKVRFHDLNLASEIMHAVQDLNYKYCTPIQTEILKNALKKQDAIGRAQTGTGKTAAFLISILDNFIKIPLNEKRIKTPRALILAPTRELVLQIKNDAVNLSKYTNFKTVAVFGGMDYNKQLRFIRGEVDILVATPGRLLDFKNKGEIDISKVETLVIDEADRMLDLGFIPDLKKIIYSLPKKDERQTLLFSATMPTDIMYLSNQWTNNPIVVEIERENVAAETIKQIVYITSTDEKYIVLFNLIKQKNLERVIIFVNRKDESRKLEKILKSYDIDCKVLSGDVPQLKRITTLEAFKAGKIKILIATDVAGRGLHIDNVSHVVNFNLPEDAEDYVHRIGRTGRAGQSGISISFACEDDSFNIPNIEEYLGEKLNCTLPEEELLTPLPEPLHKIDEEPKRSFKSNSKSYKPNYRNKGRRS